MKLLFQTTSKAILLAAAIISLASCCMLTESSSHARFQQLENAHLAFIDTYTKSATGPDKAWNESDDAQVTKIKNQFSTALSSEGTWCPARKTFVTNSAALFAKDADFIKQHHPVSQSFAKHKKDQVRQNYDLFLKK